MKTLILPGFSIKNYEWAQECAQNLKDFNIQIVKWKHWTSGNPNDFSAENEAKNLSTYGSDKVNIIAKSLGILVLTHFLSNGGIVNKLILCGIPLHDISDEDTQRFKTLSTVPLQNIILFQNEYDPHGSFTQISSFAGKIGLDVELVKKPGDDHNYPYYEDFREFLGK
ncbi:MAG: hypothetical protein US96_C0003G0022 [Candidatus Woesebacteria bacterium GW2011_GWB1_38_5b]|uniref:Alpha/beta hydrolase n=1 Tax=Candidatus Woesebacteria bacterium GW2011_GWB1_38_5b TaxID=1618569 RepID=A0A0G0MQB3_9BACT|nr:MAG: hypothetical protein US96_C0003G0022 [Candidatus Woesebacteria bacterium GW2011_GWB1_38_5b]